MGSLWAIGSQLSPEYLISLKKIEVIFSVYKAFKSNK
jgi:hypothetical protein